MESSRAVPPPVERVLLRWLAIHDELAPGLVEGLYVVGSAALGNWQPHSDIDILVFSPREPREADVDAWRRAHDRSIAELGEVKIDGPRLCWQDLPKRPESLLRPWTLDGEFYFDDECFELNPVIWLTLAKYGIAIRGRDVSDLTVHCDDAALRTWVRNNTASYWRSIATSAERALDDPTRHTFDASLTAWSVLGVARMLYTARTGDIASKSAAGRWLVEELPMHRQLVEHALVVREGPANGFDSRETVAATAKFMNHLVGLVAAT